MIIHQIDPVLFSIGPLSIRYYGLAYVLGFLFTYWWLKKSIELKKIQGLTEKKLDSLLVYLMLGVIIGGRVLQFVFFRPMSLLQNPLEVFYIWQGGMSFHGGLVGVVIALLLFCKRNKISLIHLGDELVIPAAFALALGRVANFINAEIVGTVTNTAWCVNFNNEVDSLGELICRHPTQLYEGVKTFFIGIILLLVSKVKNAPKGLLIWLFITLYGFLRFVINFWRNETPIIFSLSMGQLLSLFMGVLGATVLINFALKKSTKKKKDK